MAVSRRLCALIVCLTVSQGACFLRTTSLHRVPAASRTHARTATTPTMALEAGTRAVIERKDRVLVVGPGGRLGAVIFGWLMQASQDAFAGMKHPRGLCGHPKGARLLNSVLSSKFILARAGEDTVYA